MNQRFARMAAFPQQGTFQHVFDFLAYQRRVRNTSEIRIGGKQPDKTAFSDCLPVLVEPQHADVVHVATAVDRAARPGFGDDQGMIPVGKGLVTQGRDRPAADSFIILAQQAQAGALGHVQ